jgi:nucleotide-binding universal stress UspA family protein
MTIVAAIDGRKQTDPVVSVGADLAEAYGEELVVLHVVPEDEFEAHRREITRLDRSADYSFTQEEQSAERLVDDVVDETLGAHEASVTSVGRVGSPTEEILSLARERDARYLVIGGKKRSPVGKAVFGSVTQSVLLDADRPVVTAIDDE